MIIKFETYVLANVRFYISLGRWTALVAILEITTSIDRAWIASKQAACHVTMKTVKFSRTLGNRWSLSMN